MKKYIPFYYKQFQCIAQKCKDNCCIGWDIMIDKKSYDKYQKVTTSFKDRLDQGICHGEEPRFYLDEQKRCAFLNQENLCDIYIELGEDALCEICTKHPRFYNEYGHIMQCGLGIACEEAARLILKDGNVNIKEEETSPIEEIDEWAEILMDIEIQLLKLLDNEKYSLVEKIDKILNLTAAYQEEINFTGKVALDYEKKQQKNRKILQKMMQKDVMKSWFEFYEELDYMDEKFRDLLQNTKKEFKIRHSCYFEDEIYTQRLIEYFIYRHFIKAYEDDNLLDKIKFAILSALIIECMNQYCKDHNVCFTPIEIAKMYSKEIEYSEENIESIYEELLFS